VPVQFEATAYVPLRGSVLITPSRDVVVSPVKVPLVESNVIWVTAALLGVPLLSVLSCRNPYVPLREAFEQVAPATGRTKLARIISPAMRIILDIMVLSSSFFYLRVNLRGLSSRERQGVDGRINVAPSIAANQNALQWFVLRAGSTEPALS
jgi:hypothetical protein